MSKSSKLFGLGLLTLTSVFGITLYRKNEGKTTALDGSFFDNFKAIFNDFVPISSLRLSGDDEEIPSGSVTVGEAIPVEPTLGFVPMSAPATAEEYKTPLDSLFKKYGSRYGIDWKLLRAISWVESRWNPKAISHADALGLMQVLCNGYEKGYCENNFPSISEWAEVRKNPQQLFDPETNIRIGTQIIAWNIQRYGKEKGLAVYNRWASRLEVEPFTNQAYVDKVLDAERKFA